MLLLRHLERVGRRFHRPVLTLGNFDGVHCGHQAILRRVVTVARAVDGTAVALTFHPHPAAVLAPARTPRMITSWRTRVERIGACGVDAVVVQRFTRAFSEVTAADFIQRFLVDGLGVHTVVVGHRVSFGHGRAGNAELLQRMGATCGFGTEVIGPVEVDGMDVSSSVVRNAIRAGDLDVAQRLLGTPPSVAGRVVHGHHRGKALGFPTANIRIGNLVLPPDGVYAVEATVRGITYAGVANLGANPTFEEWERSLETHLFSFSGTLYGQRLEVRFVRYLRGQVKFPNAQALAEQIARDIEAARQVLLQRGAS